MRFLATLTICAAFMATSGVAVDKTAATVMHVPFASDDRATPGSSINPTYIVIGVLAVLLIGAAMQIEDSQDSLRDFDPAETE